MAEPVPLILDNADLLISTDGTEVGLTSVACLLNHIELSPDVSVTTLTTMCGEKDYPGAVKWSLVATLYQSFSPVADGGTEEVLSAALELGTATPFEIIPRRDDAVSATNPSFSGEVIPQPYPPINGDAGDVSTIELEWALVAPPTKSITPVAGTTAASTKTKSV